MLSWGYLFGSPVYIQDMPCCWTACESLPGMVMAVSKISIETSVKTCHTDLLNAVESSYHCVSGSGQGVIPESFFSL